jgi:hypothetical protein
MRHRAIAWLIAGLAVVLAAGYAADAYRSTDHSPVYTVGELQAHLADNARGWVGRSVRVRAIAMYCWSPDVEMLGECYEIRPRLQDQGGYGAAITLEWRTLNPPWQFLTHLPLIGRLVPPAQVIHWDTVATYRVQLRKLPAGPQAMPPSYVALLPDAVP